MLDLLHDLADTLDWAAMWLRDRGFHAVADLLAILQRVCSGLVMLIKTGSPCFPEIEMET